jgi:ribosomal protein L31
MGTKRTLIDTNETSHPPYKGELRANGDAAYANFRDRYRDMAKQFGFEGHLAWAEAMP